MNQSKKYSDFDTVGGRIGWLLRARKKRQADLARFLGRSSGFVSEVIGNKKEFNWETTAKLARYLETSTDFILSNTDEDDPCIPAQPQPDYNHLESYELAQMCGQCTHSGTQATAGCCEGADR